MKFEELKITRQFLNAIEDMGFTDATPIQEKAIPPIRAGQDLIGIAQTGTGKTLAYVVPVLQHLKYAQEKGPRCLILAPTKELVLQITEQVELLAKYTDLRIMGLYGGIGPKAQTEEMKKGKDIVIATPGRFMEIYSKEAIPVKHLKHLVLDEADRMMDMGFMPQLRNIFEIIPSKRQNLLFSATFPPRVERLSEEFLLWPTRVEVTPESTPVETVAQLRYKAPNFKTKLNLLMHLLNDDTLHRVIIFTQTKELAENIGKFLERSEVGTVRIIHSNKGQNSRINALEDFRQGEIRILVSTDVSSRGIDIPEVSHVINFSVPRDYLDYVHRIGRTGRAFKAGEAITFCDPAEEYHIRKIEGIIQTVVPVATLPAEVAVEETSKAEKQEQAREIDRQKKRENPDYQGAFHEKKRKPSSGNKSKPASRKRK